MRTITIVLITTVQILCSQSFWERTEPYSVGLNQIVLGGGDTLYGSLNSGFTRSTNNGTTWSSPIVVNFVREFDIAPNGTIFVAQNANALSRSTNKGTSFTQSSTGITETSCSSVLALASGTVLAGTRAGIYRSSNNGLNWTKTAGFAQLAEDTNIVDLARYGTTLYAIATMPNNNPEWTVAYRSTDDGVTWTKGSNKLTGATGYSLFVSPAGDLFLRTSQGVRTSTDGGNSWSTYAFGTSSIDNVAFDSSGSVYVVIDDNDSSNFVYRSSDNGLSWVPVTVPFASFTRLTVGRQGSLFLSQDQTYRSTDNGITWQALPVMFPNVTIFKESQKFGLFVTAGGSAYQNLYRSTDVGNSWKPMVTGVVGIPIIGFYGDTILVADNYYNAKIFRSVDNGATFKTISGISVISGYVNALIGTSYQSIIAGTSAGIFRSINHGKAWTKVSNTPATFLHQQPNGTMYAHRSFSGSGVFRSTDSGSTWQELKNGMGNTIVHSLAFAPNGDLFSGSDAGLFRSTDAGDNWVRIDTQIVNKPYGIYVTVSAEGKIFFGGAKNGTNSNAYQSTNGGVSWTSLDNSISSTDFQATIRSLFAASNGRLFAGTSSGLFRSSAVTTPVQEISASVPQSFELFQNYPNPFNPSTTIRFTLRSSGMTELTVCDVMGREVASLVNGPMNAGTYEIRFDAAAIASGIYFYTIRSGGQMKTNKMTLIR
jgi:photosystem II stability/assembly factor-like uncharacterized protein